MAIGLSGAFIDHMARAISLKSPRSSQAGVALKPAYRRGVFVPFLPVSGLIFPFVLQLFRSVRSALVLW